MYDTDPLSAPVEIVGRPVARIALEPQSEEHEALVPGEKYVVDVPLNGIAPRFPVGNRIRLSVSTSYRPLIWTPMLWEPVTILLNESALRLPLWSGDALGSAGGARVFSENYHRVIPRDHV